ncbi:MAG: isoleucine--tRNA ligase [Eubacterium sp.]|jgi:isoleucyl-tRNA synthetase|nr:isoleucine--tRNA ligase [Eubacterium sp.]
MFNKVSSDMDFVTRERKILEFWKENDVFQKSIEERKSYPSYVFYDGPPTANGKPHIGHVLTRVIKDMIPRYRTMKGYMVPRKAGWDTHGLPVEIEVEKALGIEGKDQVENYGIANFIDKCKESVWRYKGMWEDFSDTVGFWADMEHPYVTYNNEFIESVWWALKKIWERDLLYKGFKVVPYCPYCGTPLSSHEVAQGYKEVKERSAVVRFKVKDENAYILAWTTTPWTLPSNVALCVNAKETYVKVRHGDYTYYMAKAPVETVLSEGFEILDEFKGADLEYKEYEPLFKFINPSEKCWYVTCDDYVTLTDGTGVVHIAPAFGEDDASIGRKYKLPFVQLVDSKGQMTKETLWPGVFCKDADKEIITELKKRGLLFSSPIFEHNYPYCWRCDTPLIYYARDSWFINMTAVREDLIKNNKTINWLPEHIGSGRFGDWLENIQDWGISRNRYWGTPLNIWECECGYRHSVGSIDELKSLSPDCPDDIELHRPYIDDVKIKCEKCGKLMSRTPEVIDCWFDSGSMPFAQHHYPFENKELFEREFPADFISEAVDQTRGWFYSLLAISTLLFNKAPFKNVIVLGHVQDENGQKMSKSKGNSVDPFEALKTYGADAIRWYFYTNSAPWLPNRFHAKAVIERQRKFLGTLWNVYAFFVLYANIDGFNPNDHKMPGNLTLMDKWALSRLNSMVKQTDSNLENYRIPEAAKAIESFVDELSNWYVRRCRERFWGSEMDNDKVSAYMTLYNALIVAAKAAAPMIPFMSEEIYQNLVRFVDDKSPISIHVCAYPEVDESLIDTELECKMNAVLEIVSLGRAARNGANIKNRQPLFEMFVNTDNMAQDLSSEFINIIKDELNIKNVEFISDAEEFVSYSFKPQLKTVGPKFGKQIGEIKSALSDIDGSAAKAELDKNEKLILQTVSGKVEMLAEDLLIEVKQKEGFFTISEGKVTVSVNTTMTESLIEEGFVREIVSKIQTMRKEAGFEVMDNIAVFIKGNIKIAGIVQRNESEIKSDVLAKEFNFDNTGEHSKEWDINGEKVELGVTKIDFLRN